MPKRKYDEIKNLSLDIIYLIEERIDKKLYLLSDHEINLIRDKINKLSKKEKDEINKINEIINKKKEDNNLDLAFLDEEIEKNPGFIFNSQDFLK